MSVCTCVCTSVCLCKWCTEGWVRCINRRPSTPPPCHVQHNFHPTGTTTTNIQVLFYYYYYYYYYVLTLGRYEGCVRNWYEIEMEWHSIRAVNRNKTVVQQNWIKAVQQKWNALKQKAAFAVIPWTSYDLATEVDKKLSLRLVHWSQRFHHRDGLEKELGSKVCILGRFTLGRSVCRWPRVVGCCI